MDKTILLLKRVFELNNNFYTDTYGKISNLSLNGIINKNVRDLRTTFRVDNICYENHRLPYMYRMGNYYSVF